MTRADHVQKAERLNLAWELLRHSEASVAAEELVRRCEISKRQAYRYLQLAHGLKEPLPIGDAKVAFTVKLSQSLVQQLHQYATAPG